MCAAGGMWPDCVAKQDTSACALQRKGCWFALAERAQGLGMGFAAVYHPDKLECV